MVLLLSVWRTSLSCFLLFSCARPPPPPPPQQSSNKSFTVHTSPVPRGAFYGHEWRANPVFLTTFTSANLKSRAKRWTASKRPTCCCCSSSSYCCCCCCCSQRACPTVAVQMPRYSRFWMKILDAQNTVKLQFPCNTVWMKICRKILWNCPYYIYIPVQYLLDEDYLHKTKHCETAWGPLEKVHIQGPPAVPSSRRFLLTHSLLLTLFLFFSYLQVS